MGIVVVHREKEGGMRVFAAMATATHSQNPTVACVLSEVLL